MWVQDVLTWYNVHLFMFAGAVIISETRIVYRVAHPTRPTDLHHSREKFATRNINVRISTKLFKLKTSLPKDAIVKSWDPSYTRNVANVICNSFKFKIYHITIYFFSEHSDWLIFWHLIHVESFCVCCSSSSSVMKSHISCDNTPRTMSHSCSIHNSLGD